MTYDLSDLRMKAKHVRGESAGTYMYGRHGEYVGGWGG